MKQMIQISSVGAPLLLGEAGVRSFEGGDAVYSARVILGIDPLQYNLDYAILPDHKPMVTDDDVAKLKIYPNPANEILNIELSNIIEGSATIEIYDLNGKLCYYKVINTSQKLQSIDIRSILKGIYNIRITTNNKTENQKLVIIK